MAKRKIGLIISENRKSTDYFYPISSINFNICNLIRLGVDEIYIVNHLYGENCEFLTSKFTDRVKIQFLIKYENYKRNNFTDLLLNSLKKLSLMDYDENTVIFLCSDKLAGLINNDWPCIDLFKNNSGKWPAAKLKLTDYSKDGSNYIFKDLYYRFNLSWVLDLFRNCSKSNIIDSIKRKRIFTKVLDSKKVLQYVVNKTDTSPLNYIDFSKEMIYPKSLIRYGIIEIALYDAGKITKEELLSIPYEYDEKLNRNEKNLIGNINSHEYEFSKLHYWIFLRFYDENVAKEKMEERL